MAGGAKDFYLSKHLLEYFLKFAKLVGSLKKLNQ
jgi:hypothetical protein